MGEKAIDQRHVLALAEQVYGPGEYKLDVDGAAASVWRDGERMYVVTALEGDPVAALERHLRRRLR